MKVAIVTDSNSGITQKQAQELGVFVLQCHFRLMARLIMRTLR